MKQKQRNVSNSLKAEMDFSPKMKKRFDEKPFVAKYLRASQAATPAILDPKIEITVVGEAMEHKS